MTTKSKPKPPPEPNDAAAPTKRRGRPISGQKVSLTITIDADLVAWLVGLAGAGAPLSPMVNTVLRKAKDRG